MDIKNIDLLKLQTQFMQNDITIRGFCGALNPKLNNLSVEIQKCLIYPLLAINPDLVSEELLDKLAYAMHVDYYDVSYPKPVKINLVKNSKRIHSYQGTKYAIEQILGDFNLFASVEEWFEYGGQPYHFRVTTDASINNVEDFEKLVKRINYAKNLRSVLDAIIVINISPLQTYQAMIVTCDDNIELSMQHPI